MSRHFKYFGFGGRGTTFTFLRKGCYSEQQAICTVFLSTPALVELKYEHPGRLLTNDIGKRLVLTLPIEFPDYLRGDEFTIPTPH